MRRGIALVKERKAASLLDAAKRAGGLSIFDLTEKLAREVTFVGLFNLALKEISVYGHYFIID